MRSIFKDRNDTEWIECPDGRVKKILDVNRDGTFRTALASSNDTAARYVSTGDLKFVRYDEYVIEEEMELT